MFTFILLVGDSLNIAFLGVVMNCETQNCGKKII